MPRKVVVEAPDWYGTDPATPPAKLVAVLTLIELGADHWTFVPPELTVRM
jgi:hypothetical protein